MKRIILGGILGGIAFFMWEGLAHEVLPLGEAGIKGMSGEPQVLASIKDNVKEAGFYIFPWTDATPGLSKAIVRISRKPSQDSAIPQEA